MSILSISNPAALFIKLIFSYTLFFAAASVTENLTIKAIANVYAILVFFIMLLVWLNTDKPFQLPSRIGLGLIIINCGAILSIVINPNETNLVDFIKITIVFWFLAFGYKFEHYRKHYILHDVSIKTILIIMAILPLLIWFYQLSTGLTQFGSNQVVAFYPNRNTASLYAISLIALYNLVSSKPLSNTLILMIIAGSFGALGVLLATAIAIFITRSSRRNITVFALLLVLFILTIPHLPDTTLFNRIKTLTNVITLALGGQINLLTISYAEIIYLTGSSDHSFLFRIIHWYQLLTFYFDGPLINQIFGYGIGSTPSMTDSKLIPHNDYLRILLEIGLFGFLGMTLIIIEIVKKLFKKEEAIPVFIILFYFFSENLINSFISVSILFFVAGALLKRFEIISTKNNISH